MTDFSSFEQVSKCLLENGWKKVWMYVNAVYFSCFVHIETGITLDLFAYELDAKK